MLGPQTEFDPDLVVVRAGPGRRCEVHRTATAPVITVPAVGTWSAWSGTGGVAPTGRLAGSAGKSAPTGHGPLCDPSPPGPAAGPPGNKRAPPRCRPEWSSRHRRKSGCRCRRASGPRSRRSSPARRRPVRLRPARRPPHRRTGRCRTGSTMASASLNVTASVPWPARPRSRMRRNRPGREALRLILAFRERAAEVVRAACEPGRGLGQQPGAPHQVLLGREPRRQPTGQVRQGQAGRGVREHLPPGRVAGLRPGHPPPDHRARLFPVRRAHAVPGIVEVGGEVEPATRTGRAP